MKTIALLASLFLGLAAGLSARVLPPVLLSADLENHGHGGDAEKKVPQHYALYIAPYDEFGSIAASRIKPPSAEEIARLVRGILPEDQYVPIASKDDPVDTVIGVQWGEVSPHGPQPFVSAREGGVVKPVWAIGVGRTHVPPFLLPSDRSDLNEELSRDRFFMLISSYDPQTLRDGRVSIRWQTRTSIDSIQVNATEAWGYLAGVAQTNLAKLLDKPKLISDAPSLSPKAAAAPEIPIDTIIPGAAKLMTFEKATPPF